MRPLRNRPIREAMGTRVSEALHARDARIAVAQRLPKKRFNQSMKRVMGLVLAE